MRAITTREKNFGVFTALVCTMLLYSSVSRRTSKARTFMEEELQLNQDKIGRARELLNTAKAATEKPKEKIEGVAAAPTVDRKMSINLMKDLTTSGQLNNIRVLSTEASGASGYRIVIEAEFVEMMRFFTYLERKDGKFVIGSAQLSKSAEGVAGTPTRSLQATFQIGAKS